MRFNYPINRFRTTKVWSILDKPIIIGLDTHDAVLLRLLLNYIENN